MDALVDSDSRVSFEPISFLSGGEGGGESPLWGLKGGSRKVDTKGSDVKRVAKLDCKPKWVGMQDRAEIPGKNNSKIGVNITINEGDVFLSGFS